MKVRDIILIIYGVAILAILTDIAVRVRQQHRTYYDDSVMSEFVWSEEI